VGERAKPEPISRLEAIARAKGPTGVIYLMGARRSLDEKWSVILRRDPCVYCGQRRPFEKMTVDHIEARSKGHRHTGTKNGAPACFHCNQAKADDSLLAFLARRPPFSNRTKWLEIENESGSTLRVELTTAVRQRAHKLLGANPDYEWWTVVAERIKSRTLRATSYTMRGKQEDARWVVPVTSVNGVDLDLVVGARLWTMGFNVRVQFHGIWIGEANG
jgi:hypothetical protein